MIDALPHGYWLAASKHWRCDRSASAPVRNEVVRILQIPRQGRPKIFPMFAKPGTALPRSQNEVIVTHCKYGHWTSARFGRKLASFDVSGH